MFAIPAVVHCTLLHAGTDTRDACGREKEFSSPNPKGQPGSAGADFEGGLPAGARILVILGSLIGAGGGYPMRASSDRWGIWIGSLPAMASIERVTSEPSLFVDLPHTATTSALAAGIHPVGSRILATANTTRHSILSTIPMLLRSRRVNHDRTAGLSDNSGARR